MHSKKIVWFFHVHFSQGHSMAKHRYIIYADESDRKGKYFSNFFGGALVRTSDRETISAILNDKKAS